MTGKHVTQEACEHEDFVIYIGYTRRALNEECLRWLTARGACTFDDAGEVIPGTECGNRPVLLHSDDSTITMNEARERYGFDSFVFYTNELKVRP